MGEQVVGRRERKKRATWAALSAAPLQLSIERVGVGNAYSDEVLHAARLSPYATAGRLTEASLDRLHEALQRVLRDAVARSVGQGAARLKAEKRAGLAVHGRAGFLPDWRQAAGRPPAVPADSLMAPSG